jgi:hypothetical protein
MKREEMRDRESGRERERDRGQTLSFSAPRYTGD